MPAVSATTPELHSASARSEQAQIYVAMPGTVISYDAAKQTAKIRPGINRVIHDEEGEEISETIPPFENVPVMWVRCAAFSIHAVLAPGDKVRLVFNSDSVAEWRQGAQEQISPGDLKRLGLSHPTCDPGFYPNNAPGLDTDTSLGKPGGLRLHFGNTAISAGEGLDFVAMAQKVDAFITALKSAGSAGAAVVAGPETGAAAFFTALAAIATPGTASSNLKAD